MNELPALRKTNYFMLILTLFCIFIIFYVDFIRFTALKSGVKPVYWFLDTDLESPLSLKGQLMVVCTIFCIPPFFGYLYNSIKLRQIQQKKEDKYLSSLILSASNYFLFARLVEFLYIPSDSDFAGIHYIGQFNISFDVVGISLFLVFAVKVFLAEYVERNKRIVPFAIVLGFSAVGVVIFAILSYIYSPDLTFALPMIIGISILLLLMIMVITLVAFAKIIRLKNRVEEKRKEILLIGVVLLLLILIGLMIVLNTIATFIISEEAGYMFRLLKLIIHIILFIFVYLSLIKPSFSN